MQAQAREDLRDTLKRIKHKRERGKQSIAEAREAAKKIVPKAQGAGLTMNEIAQELGLTPKSVYELVHGSYRNRHG